MQKTSHQFFRPQTSTVFVLYATLVMAVISTAIISGCAPAASKKLEMATPTVATPTLFALSQTGNLTNYHQTNEKQTWQISVASPQFSPVIGNGTHLISDGHMLYTATDRLQASTFSGNVRWQRSLSAPADDLLQVQQTLYALSASGELSAWTSTHGTLLWLQSGASLPLGPWAPLMSDGKRIFLGGEDRVIALDATSGKIVWQDDLDPGDGAEHLFVVHDTLLVQTGSLIIALQSNTGTALWQRESHIQALYIDPVEKLLYTASIDVPDPVTHPTAPTWRGFRACDVATGKQVWAVAQPLFVTGMSSIAANGFLSREETSIFAWSLQGKQLWQHAYAGAPIRQIVAISQTGTDLVFAQDSTLTAFNSHDGTQQWQQMLTPDPDDQLSISHGQYWITSKAAGDIAAYSLQGGTKQWSLTLPPLMDIDIQ